jgi:hypothetical protein
MPMLKTCFIFAGWLIFSLQALASDLFESDKVIEVKLTGPLNTLIRKKQNEQPYPFTIQEDGVDFQITIFARGNSRKELCVFPPLKLHFDTLTPPESAFYAQQDLKLVSHCNKSQSAQSNTLKEYAAYQFFSELSDAAYRVRLLHIDYADTTGKRSTQKWAYNIDPPAAGANRFGGDRVKLPALCLTRLDDQQEALVYVFQYLIGNTDWSMVSADNSENCCHNGKLIEKNQKLLYVPYDFDLSGLVNAGYAHPAGSLPIKRVTQRLYRGFCMDQPTLRSAIVQVRSRQADFKRIVDQLPVISKSERTKMHRFLDRFFKKASNEDKMLKSFEKRCLD